MQIRQLAVLAGPNVWSQSPVLEARVSPPARPASPASGFGPRAAALLGRMTAHLAATNERDETLAVIGAGADLAETLLRCALLLQQLAAMTRIEFGLATTDAAGEIHLAIGYEDASFGRACLESAIRLCQAALDEGSFDADAERQQLRDLADKVCLGPSTRAIIEAAAARGIPARRMNSGSLVQLGYAAAQRRVWAAETDRTTAIGEAIAKDKELTKSLLRAVGVPVPAGRPVESADDAWAAAEEIGVPVVVKPRDANHGRGVAINLTARAQVLKAFATAEQEGSGVLVEQFARGAEHRLLVVGKRVVAAARGEPDQVVGDGRRSIAELVEELNRDPRRGTDYASTLYMVRIDPAAASLLEQQGYRPDSVPPAGTTVLLHYNGDLTTDETDQVHPDVAAQAVLAAQVVGLDIAGVDLIVEDIGRPLTPQGGMIVEVNAGPSLQAHVQPLRGRPQPVGAAIVGLLFPEGASGRVPLVAIAGDGLAEPVTRLVAHLLRQGGRRVGWTSQRGCFFGERAIQAGDATNGRAATLLANPLLDALVLQLSDAGIRAQGLPFDRADVAVLTDVAVGADGAGEAPAWHDRVFVRRVLAESLAAGGVCVLPAAEPWAPLVAEHAGGATCLFAADESPPLVQAHLRGGGQVVYVRHGDLVLATGTAESPLLPLADIPALAGEDPLPVSAVLAAVAAAWSVGVHHDELRDGLRAFH